MIIILVRILFYIFLQFICFIYFFIIFYDLFIINFLKYLFIIYFSVIFSNFLFFRLTDLGSVTTVSTNVSTLKKKTSSTPGGDNFYPLPTPVYKQTSLPILEEPEEEKTSSSSDEPDHLPHMQPGDFLMLPNRPKDLPTTPELQRRNFLKDIKIKSKELVNIMYSSNEVNVQPEEPKQEQEEMSGCAKYWIGKDYCNFIVKDFTNLEAPFADFIERTTTPRMPWHDIAACVQGAAARDVARHFIQRWNATKLEKARLNNTYPYLLPKSYTNCLPNDNRFLNVHSHKVSCQVLRSCSTWSAGFLEPDTKEQSIHEAYVDAITHAEHYIYIENQFFVSLGHGNGQTRNQISETLYKRILRAHK